MAACAPADAAQYKLGMRQLAGAVNIITSLHAGKPWGMTATAVCSASAEPPTVLVCINQSAATHQAILEAGIFCVNVLRDSQAVALGDRVTVRLWQGSFGATVSKKDGVSVKQENLL